jgi:3-dehydroquinate synthetase
MFAVFQNALIHSALCPAAVLIDIATLDTLPDRELASGISEIIKYGLIRDAPFFEWLEANMGRLLARDREVWANYWSIRAEQETGPPACGTATQR